MLKIFNLSALLFICIFLNSCQKVNSSSHCSDTTLDTMSITYQIGSANIDTNLVYYMKNGSSAFSHVIFDSSLKDNYLGIFKRISGEIDMPELAYCVLDSVFKDGDTIKESNILAFSILINKFDKTLWHRLFYKQNGTFVEFKKYNCEINMYPCTPLEYIVRHEPEFKNVNHKKLTHISISPVQNKNLLSNDPLRKDIYRNKLRKLIFENM